jgi:hypothetical protein
MQTPGLHIYPAIVKSYNGDSRQCRVEVEGITTGGEDSLIAEILNPIGDKGHHTELQISGGDLVWVSFINGDLRYPLIMGYRNKDAGNSQGTRRWHHANIEMQANEQFTVISPTITLQGDVRVTGNMYIAGNTSTDGNITSAGTITDSDGNNGA